MNDTKNKTLAAFIAEHAITIDVRRTDLLPSEVEAWGKDPGANHYKVRVRVGRRSMTIRFHTGSGWKADPDAEDVLGCLHSDAGCLEYSSFDEWCRDIGSDSDSLTEHRAYKACVRQALKLKTMLGSAWADFRSCEAN